MRVCVFCGSSPPPPSHADAGRALGAALGPGSTLVYGGASVGLMGVVADAALAAGAEVVGVIPDSMRDRELAHPGLTELLVVGSMHERKARMYERADAFVALPGGIGTLDELAEIVTWSQLGLHDKPVALLDVDGFWGPLLAWLDRCVADGYLRAARREAILVDDDPVRLLSRL